MVRSLGIHVIIVLAPQLDRMVPPPLKHVALEEGKDNTNDFEKGPHHSWPR